jgi:hypothetical protein
MREKRSSFTFLFTGCLLLFAAVFLSLNIYGKSMDYQGRLSMDKVTVNVKNEAGFAQRYFFSQSDIEKLRKALNTDLFCYSAQGSSVAVYGGNSVNVRITGACELEPMFSDIKLKKGSFFSASDNTESSRVAVIEERAAWKLLNNDDVLGCDIMISGSRFKIIGVSESDGSVLGKLADDGKMQVYIPVRTYLDMNPDSGITCFQYGAGSGDSMDESLADLNDALASEGKDRNSLDIVHYGARSAAMRQKPELLIFIMGLYIILAMLIYSIRKLSKTIYDIRNECKNDYFLNAVRTFRTDIIRNLLLLSFAAAFSVLIWRLVRFELYVPTELIPDDFTDLSYYMRLLRQKISLNLLDAGFVPPFPEVRADKVETALNLVFYICSVSGALLYYTGLALVKKETVLPEKAVLLGGISVAACSVTVSLLSYAAGLPAALELKSIVVFWIFVFVSLLKKSTFKYGREISGLEIKQALEREG